MGRTKLQYTDEDGELHVAAEATSKPWSEIVVSTATVPERPERSRDEVLSRLRRAFEHNGWTMVGG